MGHLNASVDVEATADVSFVIIDQLQRIHADFLVFDIRSSQADTRNPDYNMASVVALVEPADAAAASAAPAAS